MKIDDIRAFNPCYDPGLYLPDGWEGDAVDLMKREGPSLGKLWTVCRPGWVDRAIIKQFAMWCYTEALNYPDVDNATSGILERLVDFPAEDLDELIGFAAAKELAHFTGSWDAQVAKLLEMLEE